jgi:hypothetical protein
MILAAIGVWLACGFAAAAYELSRHEGGSYFLAFLTAISCLIFGPVVWIMYGVLSLPWCMGWACGWVAGQFASGYDAGYDDEA